MARTLYRSRHADEIGPAYEPHPGLLFERFPSLFQEGGVRYDIPDGGRRHWLETFIKQTGAANARLVRHHARMDELLARAGGQQRQFITSRRLAIGLGNPNAAEIGFSFDHATGLPVIAGSTVKGLAAAGARLLGKDAEARQLLGEEAVVDKGFLGRPGRIAFLDAHPLAWPPPGAGTGFEIDIINPHNNPETLHSRRTPLDSDKLRPVHFLVVGPGVTFVFRLLPLEPDADLLSVWTWLETALHHHGAGGKTAVGYGEMVAVDDPEPVTDAELGPGTVAGKETPHSFANGIRQENAPDRIPRLLGMVAGADDRDSILRNVFTSLNPRWVRRRARKGDQWARDLLDAVEKP